MEHITLCVYVANLSVNEWQLCISACSKDCADSRIACSVGGHSHFTSDHHTHKHTLIYTKPCTHKLRESLCFCYTEENVPRTPHSFLQDLSAPTLYLPIHTHTHIHADIDTDSSASVPQRNQIVTLSSQTIVLSINIKFLLSCLACGLPLDSQLLCLQETYTSLKHIFWTPDPASHHFSWPECVCNSSLSVSYWFPQFLTTVESWVSECLLMMFHYVSSPARNIFSRQRSHFQFSMRLIIYSISWLLYAVLPYKCQTSFYTVDLQQVQWIMVSGVQLYVFVHEINK